MSKFSEGPWFVYILLCENDKLYTGIAKDVAKRFKVHKAGKGAKYTKINRPIRIVHCEEFEEHRSAAKREREIKTYPKTKKILLNNFNTD